MNQILSTEMNSKGKPTNIKTVKIVFAICIIIFGICIASGGGYALYQNKFANQNPSITPGTENTVTPGNNEIKPKTDINIVLAVVNNKIQATITGEDEISFITYKWDSEEETKQDINNVSGKVEIDIPEGLHTLTLVAVDKNNNTETKTQEVRGVKKPSLQVTHNGEKFIVRVADESGLDRVEFELNGKGYLVRLEGVKEREFSYPLETGENVLKVTVYNINGATETFNALYKK